MDLDQKISILIHDYHLVASTGVNEALTFLLDHMPAQLHVVVASREEPEISLGRLRVSVQLVEIRQQDLRFGLEEADAFFNQGGDVRLSKSQVSALEARTEGWVSGLELAAQSLRMLKDPETFIAFFTGNHQLLNSALWARSGRTRMTGNHKG